MPTPRSPRYPSISLDEAVSLAQKLWDREKKTPVSPAVVANAWSYKGLSGAVRSKIGSLRQFGLLDATRDGVKVSDLAIEILVQPKGSDNQRRALLEAALKPSLFSEVYSTHKDASDEALRAHLITKKGFNVQAAKQFVSSFRDTLAIVSGLQLPYSDGESSDDGVDLESETSRDPVRKPLPPEQGGLSLRVPFGGSFLNVRIEASGQQLVKEPIARVRKYLELAEDDLKSSDDESVAKAAS